MSAVSQWLHMLEPSDRADVCEYSVCVYVEGTTDGCAYIYINDTNQAGTMVVAG